MKLEGDVAASVFADIVALSRLLLVYAEIFMFSNILVSHCIRDILKLWLDYFVGTEWFSLFQGNSTRLYSIKWQVE